MFYLTNIYIYVLLVLFPLLICKICFDCIRVHISDAVITFIDNNCYV